jgi:hypothetical protein
MANPPDDSYTGADTCVSAEDYAFTAGRLRWKSAAIARPLGRAPRPSRRPVSPSSVDPKLFERIVNQTALGPDKQSASGAWCRPVPLRAGG